jgi:hypothetical protein
MEAKDQVNREDLQKEVDEYAARSYEAEEFADLQIPAMNKEIMTRSTELDEECQTMMGNLLGGDYVDPGKYNDAKFILAQLGDTKESIDNIKTTAAQLETYVKLFKLPVAEYQNLTDAVDLYETRMKLWTMVDKFNDDTDGYLNSDIRTITVDDLVKDVQEVVKESTKMSKKSAGGSRVCQAERRSAQVEDVVTGPTGRSLQRGPEGSTLGQNLQRAWCRLRRRRLLPNTAVPERQWRDAEERLRTGNVRNRVRRVFTGEELGRNQDLVARDELRGQRSPR